jgi:hypothetical protein
MAFSDFKSTLEIAQKYGTRITKKKFLPQDLRMELASYFLDDLAYSLSVQKPNPSEIAISENLISPMIRLVARKHPHIIFWSREYYLEADKDLCGTPDYLFSYRFQTDEIMLGTPLVCVSEAKIDDFVKAWAQTLAEMVAIQKLFPELTIYGWATNGSTWEFGKLENNIFTQHTESYSIARNSAEIAGILDWIFTEAVQNAEKYLAAKAE